MHIIVCLKQIVYAYARTGFDPETNFLAPGDTITCVNRHDEAALELALQVKDTIDNTRVTLLTLGPLLAENELRRCLALGADRLCRIDLEGGLDPWAKARVMASFIKEMSADLILLRKGVSGQTERPGGGFSGPGTRAAVCLRRQRPDPFRRRTRNEGRAKRRPGNPGNHRLSPAGPVYCGMGIGRAPASPPIRTKSRARSRTIEILPWEGEKPSPRLIQKRVFPPRPRPKRIPAPDSRLGASERIRQLLAGSRMEKKGVLLTGTPESQVEAILSFLKDHDFLRLKITPKEEKENGQ